MIEYNAQIGRNGRKLAIVGNATFSGDEVGALGEFLGVDLETMIGEIGGDEELFPYSVGGVGDKLAKIGKAIVHSPITKTVAAGVAVVYPPVGVPLVAAVTIADKAVTMAQSKKPAEAKVGKAVIAATKAEAAKDPNAARAFKLMEARYKDPVKFRSVATRLAKTSYSSDTGLQKAVGWVITQAGRVHQSNQIRF
jgi:hypothetical protein